MMNLENIESTDHSKFRLIGQSVLLYRFVVPHDTKLFVGDIIKVIDTMKKYTFFAKVCDLSHAHNFSDVRWDTRPYGDRFYNINEDVFIAVDAVPLGFLDEDGTFKKPRTIPTKFSRVLPPTSDDLSFLTRSMGDIEVGVMKTGHGVLKDVFVCIPSSILPQHMGVFATTGMGKSNFMKVFAASCMKAQKFGLLIVDPHGEYLKGTPSSTGAPTMGLIHYTTGKDGLTVFTIRDEKERKRYNLNRLWIEFGDFRMSDLGILYDISGPQRDIIESLDDYLGGDVIGFFKRLDPETFDANTHTNLSGIDREIAYRLRNSMPGPLRVLQRRIENLVNGNRMFFREGISSIPEIIRHLHQGKVVLIDIPRMGERSELFVLSVIARAILERHKEKAKHFGIEGEETIPKVLIAIEEAQRVLGAPGAGTQVFRECAMEGRKFGVGLCVVTQQPKNVDPKVLAQINTFVIMGLGDRNDREILSSSAKQDLSRLDIEIQTLDRGEAIISTLGIPFPVSTRIHLFEEYVPLLCTTQKRSITEGLDERF